MENQNQFKSIALFGGSGLIGQALASSLSKAGHEVQIAGRSSSADIQWDPERAILLKGSLENVDVIINLSGARILPKRWTPSRKRELIDSRVGTTLAIQEILDQRGWRVDHFIQISAIGYYGDRSEPTTESSGPGTGFLAELCVDWEKAATRLTRADKTSILRLGLYLHPSGGIVSQLGLLARFFVLTKLPGDPWVCYTHRDELDDAVLALVSDELEAGTYNVVGKQPMRYSEMARAIANRHGRPVWPAPPAFAIRLVLGQAAEALLNNGNILSDRLPVSLYRFHSGKEAIEKL